MASCQVPGSADAVVSLGGHAPIEIPVALAAGDKLTVGVRPQHATLTGPKAGAMAMEVTLVEQLGAETIVHGRTISGDPFTVTTSGQQNLAVGDQVGVDVQIDRVHFFSDDGRCLIR